MASRGKLKNVTPPRVVVVILLVGAIAFAQGPTVLRSPTFRAEPSWPTIPNNWIFGEVSSIAVDSQDHVWILQRPLTVPADQRGRAAPPLMEFDAAGNFLQSWGGQAQGYEWPEREHGVY